MTINGRECGAGAALTIHAVTSFGFSSVYHIKLHMSSVYYSFAVNVSRRSPIATWLSQVSDRSP